MDMARTDAAELVYGRRVIAISDSELRHEATRYARVVVDIGAGDGRFVYRLARDHPSWLCIGIDASAEALRETSFRASRKAPRGGVPNARFVRAAAERLPAAVWGIADEIYILMPWGSLLRAVLGREAQILRGIARAGKPGALVHVRVNASILRDERLAATIGLHTPWDERTEMRLRDGYAVAGLRVIRLAWEYIDTRTSWGRRLGSGRPVEVLAIDAAIR